MMETYRERKPGSVRLNDDQYEEMELLGFENESQYLRYKLNESPMHVNRSGYNTPAPIESNDSLSDKLALQRAELENERLREKIDSLSQSQEQTLNGVNGHVSKLLEEELLKRDFEALKKENTSQSKQIEKLESQLQKAEDQSEEKDHEIGELVRKLSIIEVGKALLPGAVTGLAKKYPKQLQGLAETLGALGGEIAALPEHNGLTDEQQEQITFAQYFQNLFGEDILQEAVLLIGKIAEAQQADSTILQKIDYYLGRLATVREAKNKENNDDNIMDENQTENNDERI